jgi:hypothetical protein
MKRRITTPVGRMLVFAICFSLVFQLGPFAGNTQTQSESTAGELPSTRGLDDPEPTQSVDYLSDTVWIPQGGQFYLKFDQATNSIVQMRMPDPTAGMPQSIIDAVDRSPDWLKDNITRKFEQLVDNDIDVGSRSTPEYADLDGDGDADLIVGNTNGFLDFYENLDPALHYLEGHDVFVGQILKKNASMSPGLSFVGRVDPSVGDVDNDGLLDLLIGTQAGDVYFVENIGTVNVPSWAAEVVLPNVIAATGSASIDLEDIDGNGYPDIILGETDGTLHYFENTLGSFNEVMVGLEWTDVGDNSAPAFADMDDDGDFDLTVGTNIGLVKYFRNDTTNWTEDPSMYEFIDLPSDAAPVLLDLNLDFIPDLVLGQGNGKLHYYQNIGDAAQPRWWMYESVGTSFNYANHRKFYSNNNTVYLQERNIPARAIQFANIINNVPQKMVDELVFSISHSGKSSLMHPSTWADVWLNNTQTLYYNDAYLDYANIVDYNLGMPDQFSTVEYWVKEDDSGILSRYEYPPYIYYWWIVHPKGSDELPTFINPRVKTSGHGGASLPPPAGNGTFWRWSVFNEADTSWPDDSALSVKYPKEENPPLLRDKMSGIQYLWDGVAYSTGRLYNNSGETARNNTGFVIRPWTTDTHALEVATHWVESTLALNAQEHNDGNRPRQISTIQFEHNGNCGELSDLTLGALRATLIPYIEILGIAGDHCYGAFYERGWHQIDNHWSASTSIVDNWDLYHYGWNRDWGSLITYRGDGAMMAPFPMNETQKIFDANGWRDPDFVGSDRGNVTVKVTDGNGNPIDGVRVSLADWNWMIISGASFGGAWTYSDGDGIAYFTTSETRQRSMGDNNYNEGLLIHLNSRYGEETWNPGFANRLMINVPGISNETMYYVNWTTPNNKSRPFPLFSQGPPLTPGNYQMKVRYNTEVGLQHPANGFGLDDSTLTTTLYHDQEVFTGIHVDAFVVNWTEFQKFLKGYPFEGYNATMDRKGTTLAFDVPSSEDWYVVLSNRDSVETSKLVSFEATIQDLGLPPDISVLPPDAVAAQLSGTSLDYITLTWTLSGDDGAGEDDVIRYDIYSSTNYNGPGKGYMKIASVGAGINTCSIPAMGADSLHHFFYVAAVDDALNLDRTPNQAAKVAIPVYQGKNLVSSILDTLGQDIPSVFQTLAFDKVWMYVGTDPVNPWRSSTPGKQINDLDLTMSVDPATAYWIEFNDGGLLRIVGEVREVTNIPLKAGWNLVGYPSVNADYTVADLKIDTGATAVEGAYYAAPIYSLRRFSDSDTLIPGHGYWLYIPSDTIWIVNF